MDAAVYSGILVRPHMSKRQFEHFTKRQIDRYTVKPTSEAGTPFLVNGGFQLQKPHPATEMNMEQWTERPWQPSMANPLDMAYKKAVAEREVALIRELHLLTGNWTWDRNTSRVVDAAPPAETVGSDLKSYLTSSTANLWVNPKYIQEWQNPSGRPEL